MLFCFTAALSLGNGGDWRLCLSKKKKKKQTKSREKIALGKLRLGGEGIFTVPLPLLRARLFPLTENCTGMNMWGKGGGGGEKPVQATLKVRRGCYVSRRPGSEEGVEKELSGCRRRQFLSLYGGGRENGYVFRNHTLKANPSFSQAQKKDGKRGGGEVGLFASKPTVRVQPPDEGTYVRG